MTKTAFDEHIRRTVDEFLQTVVIVDDEAFRKVDSPLVEDEDWQDDAEQVFAPRVGRLQNPGPEPDADYLDVQKTTRAFGLRGLACAVLSPQSEQENRDVKDPFLRTARRADLVVLDWNLNDDYGRTTVKLFRAILQRDARDRGAERRLRVVAVYTGEPKLGAIADELARVVEALMPDEPIDRDSELPQFSCGPVRVTVLAKEFQLDLGEELRDQQVTIDALPDRLADEFARLCSGLVASAAVAAITGIRAEAHRLLVALGPSLDPAYLGQRTKLNHPSEAERQIEELITAEIGAIIADRQVGGYASMARIDEWLSAQSQGGNEGCDVLGERFTQDARRRFLVRGLSDEQIDGHNRALRLGLRKSKYQRIRRQATQLFAIDEATAEHADRAFAQRMVVRTRYSQPKPILQLGTVIERKKEFLLCVQPLCDSVRLKEPTFFPFLRLTATDPAAREKNAITLLDRGRWIELTIDGRPGRLRLLRFAPVTRQVVSAHRHNGDSKFRSVDRHQYRWVTDLKAEYAQRVVERLAGQFSRIGLTESEYLRDR